MRLEIEPVDLGQQAPGSFQLAVNKRRIEDQLRCLVSDLRLPPRLNLPLQRLEVPLNPVHSDRERINQVETLGVLGQDRREHAYQCQAELCWATPWCDAKGSFVEKRLVYG